MPIEELGALFIEAMQRLAERIDDPNVRSLTDDVTAEFDLRDLKPPYSLIPKEMGRIGSAILRLFENLDEDRKAVIEAEMLAEYVEGQKRSN